jgi:hypothetical protein
VQAKTETGGKIMQLSREDTRQQCLAWSNRAKFWMTAALAAENQSDYAKALENVTLCADAYESWVKLLRTFDK